MELLARFRKKISRINYAAKLFYTYLIIVCIILFMFSGTSTYYSSQAEMNRSIYTAKNMLYQTSEFITYKVSSIKNIINVISADDTIQSVISSSEDFDRNYLNNWIVVTTTAKSIMYNANTSNDIRNIRLYAMEGAAAFENSGEFKDLDNSTQEKWLMRLKDKSSSSSFWLPSSFFPDSESLSSITFVKKIPDSKNLNKHLGVITASVKDSAFQDVISQAAATPNSTVLLYNSFGETIMYHGQEGFLNAEDMTGFKLQPMTGENQSFSDIRFKDKDYLAGLLPIDNSDWSLALLIPKSDILASTRLLVRQIFLMAALLILFMIPVLFMTSKSLSSRIYRLKEYITRSVASNFQAAPLSNGNGEIGDLTEHFNQMAVQMSDLLKEQYALGYQIKDLEFQVLQSQINPHFLYNTLDMIYWLGLDNHAPDVANAAKELGRFYMLSLGHGETIVTLKQELDHVAAYVNIQNMRFENHFHLTIDVPEELYPYKIIKIILQPLVENSILHGIREKSTETGSIRITAGMDNGVITVTIEDDGVGIPADKIGILLTRNKNHSGYGVWNIHERIQLSYGNQYGLQYSSRQYNGTTVRITFPAV